MNLDRLRNFFIALVNFDAVVCWWFFLVMLLVNGVAVAWFTATAIWRAIK